MTRKPHAHPDHDVLFAKAQELDVPLGIHPSWEPPWAFSGRYAFEYVHKQNFWINVTAGDSIRQALTSFMQYGTLEKFPRLKLVLLEAGAGWISYWLDRMDAAFSSYAGRRVPLKEKPSFYFHRNVWISADPDERALPAMVALEGEDKFFWASDFPHSDYVTNYIEELEEMAGKLSASAIPESVGRQRRAPVQAWHLKNRQRYRTLQVLAMSGSCPKVARFSSPGTVGLAQLWCRSLWTPTSKPWPCPRTNVSASSSTTRLRAGKKRASSMSRTSRPASPP